MASEIKLPELGENIESGEVVDIRVEPGDVVKEGQELLEVEAEKSSLPVPAPLAGRITQILVKRGDKVQPGQTLFLLESNGASPQADQSKPEEKKAAPKPAPPPTPSPQREPAPPPPAIAPTAKGTPTGDGERRIAPETTPAPTALTETSKRVVPAGPATRRLARELGVDLSLVHGSAKGGRVTPDDVKAFVRELASGTGRIAGPLQAPLLPDFARWGPVEKQALDALRRRTAAQMALSWSLIPHVTQHDLADITDLEAFRKQQSEKGPKLTVTAFALKASAIALRQFPQFNASLDLANGHLILKQYYHLGVAVDTERGLLVPVVRDVDKKSVFELGQELVDLAERARDKKLKPDEMSGGTFTITNLGGIGGTAFTPIVNYPEVAILGLSRGRQQPVIRDGQVVPRLMLPLSLSYDHRVIDGADAARFARRIVEMLENPLVMLLHA